MINTPSQPVILITNDDGITAPGIAALVEVAKEFGQVYVVAPDKPQSGMGHAITIHSPIRAVKESLFDGVTAYHTSGTPVDCVKFAVDKVLHQKPDLCLSGINHGANHSINVIYSGTMSAAMEGAIENIPSAGFSLLDFSWDADFTVAKQVVRQMISFMLSQKLPDHTLFNVNIPKVTPKEYKGIRITRQGKASWDENFMHRKDPSGHDYYWLAGNFTTEESNPDTDIHLLKNGYATVVPVQFDLTNYTLLEELKNNSIFNS